MLFLLSLSFSAACCQDSWAVSRAWRDWFAEREPWNPTGGVPEWLYVRQGA